MASAGESVNDEDVPPLEDMSDVLQNLSELGLQKRRLENKAGQKINYLEATETEEATRIHRIEELLGKEKHNSNVQLSEKTKKVSSSEAASGKPKKAEASFGGFKKGFLLANPSKSDVKKKSTNDKNNGPRLVEVKQKAGTEKQDPLFLSEVQESLKSQMPLLQSKEWITDDLLSKVAKNPKLLKQLEDPKFSEALAAFQNNPKSIALVMQKDPEVREFIQDFCALLGDHFTQLGDNEEISKKSHKASETLVANSSRRIIPNPPGNVNAEEEEKFKQIINDPAIRDILSDPQIQNLITVLKERPEAAQRTLAELGPEYHGKIQRLVAAGLLGVSR